MKRVGTITAALGFIYLGIWMIFKNYNNIAANYMFKWWPILIIVFGIEILVYYGGKKSEEKIGFNGMVIFVLILFIIINSIQFTAEKFNLGLKWLGNNTDITEGIDFLKGINESNYKVISSSENVEQSGKILSINASNSDIKIRKTSDKNIKIEANIFVSKSFDGDKYNLKINRQIDGYLLDINEPYIKKSEIYVYVPDGMNIKVNSNNLRFRTEDSFTAMDYVIKASNGEADITGGNSVTLDYNNGSVKLSDVVTIDVKGNNGSFNFNGNCQNINLKANNGTLNINNKNTKNINVNMNLGTIVYHTEEKNISINASVNHGAIDINGEKKINAPMEIVSGNGEGKATIHIDNGTITVKNQE